jgi:hypothetical protein
LKTDREEKQRYRPFKLSNPAIREETEWQNKGAKEDDRQSELGLADTLVASAKSNVYSV